MQWLTLMVFIYAGFASANGRTDDEDQSVTSSSSSSSISPLDENSTILAPEKCFYKTQDECPKVTTPEDCPCKRIKVYPHTSSDENAVFCCNLNLKNFEFGLGCASEYSILLLI